MVAASVIGVMDRRRDRIIGDSGSAKREDTHVALGANNSKKVAFCQSIIVFEVWRDEDIGKPRGDAGYGVVRRQTSSLLQVRILVPDQLVEREEHEGVEDPHFLARQDVAQRIAVVVVEGEAGVLVLGEELAEQEVDHAPVLHPRATIDQRPQCPLIAAVPEELVDLGEEGFGCGLQFLGDVTAEREGGQEFSCGGESKAVFWLVVNENSARKLCTHGSIFVDNGCEVGHTSAAG